MSIGIVLRSFGTHNGSFHADEVTACALLLYFQYIDRDKIYRTREERRLHSCDFVCDVGGVYDPTKRRFDHHQIDYRGDLSSAGMVLRYLKGEKALSEAFFEYLNRTLIHGIDEIDNGKIQPLYGHCSFSQLITTYVPVCYDAPEEEVDEAFFEALDLTLGLLARLENRFLYMQKCKALVADVMDKMDECLIFDRAMPWIDAFFELGGENHKAEFVIMPSGHHWKLRGIPPSLSRSMQVRNPLPEEWAGLSNEDLKKKTGIPGAIFCHKGRFFSVWEEKADALKALKMVLEQKKTKGQA